MTADRSRRALQAALGAVGTVATVAGLDGVLRGPSAIRDTGEVSPSVDSEFRFFAAWYAVLGALTLRAARSPEEETTVVQACGAGFLLAAAGRTISLARVGRPQRRYTVLLGVEVVLAATLVPWQRRLAR